MEKIWTPPVPEAVTVMAAEQHEKPPASLFYLFQGQQVVCLYEDEQEVLRRRGEARFGPVSCKSAEEAKSKLIQEAEQLTKTGMRPRKVYLSGIMSGMDGGGRVWTKTRLDYAGDIA